MNPSTALARVLVDELVRCGVREAVLCPGSRNAPLSFALHDADAAGRLRLHVRIDERTAAFLALGLARGSGAPVAVATTSGTAVANLHPAVLEAAHAGVPLVVLSADRPAELRGTGANQSTDHLGVLRAAVRWQADVPAPEERPGQVRYWRNIVSRAVAAAQGRRTGDPGPVHLNVGVREPLVPDADPGWPEPLDATAGSTRVPDRVRRNRSELEPGPRTVVIAGDGAGSQARELAETAGWPLLAEPSSGARSGPNAVGPYRLLLEHAALVADVERVVALGRPTLSRPVTRLLSRDDVELVVAAPLADWPDVGRSADVVLGGYPALRGVIPGAGRAEPDAWLSRWLDLGARARAALDRVLDAEPHLTGPAVARAVAAVLEPGSLLVVGSSNPVRDLDLAAAPFDAEPPDRAPLTDDAQPLRRERAAEGSVVVLANRGLSGIDGTVSTAVGAALAHDRGQAYALLGDLTFLHDATGLVIGPGEPRPDLVIVVVNDDGGGIFGLLEQGAPEHAASFERVFGTPTGVDLAALCAATGTPHVRADSAGALRAALAAEQGIRVVEVPVGRRSARDLHARLRAAVASALTPPGGPGNGAPAGDRATG